MSGVWVFKNGVYRLVGAEHMNTSRQKALLHIPSGEIISSYASLQEKLLSLGWERYYEHPNLLQFHRPPSLDFISLPKSFSQFRSVYMFDIVVKNRDIFHVVDAESP